MFPIGPIHIVLNKAANGWIVTLPVQYNHEPEFNWTDPENIKKVVGAFQSMKEEMQRDPMLEKLGHYDDPGPVGSNGPIGIHGKKEEQNNVYIFTTYDEAAAFIKERYDN